MSLLKSQFILFFIFCSGLAMAQTKYDKIIKKDYQIIEGTVTKIADKFIEYNLPNETLVYNLDISKIARIDFANGKTQSFLGTAAPAPQNANPENLTYQGGYEEMPIRPNTVAVLPVPFENSDSHSNSESMSKFAQNDVYSNLVERAANLHPLEIQDLRTTNSLLRKANINYRNVDEVSISDLQKILGVDNVVAVKVSYTILESKSTVILGPDDVDDFALITTDDDKFYEFMVYFDLYKNNKKIYTKTRKPFLSMKDSWIDAVNYLLKRSPYYSN